VKLRSLSIASGIGLIGGLVFHVFAQEASSEESVANPPGSAVRGQTIYLKSCSACHGDKGDANSMASIHLNPYPRNFTTGLYKFRTTASGELPTDADLAKVVKLGIPGTQMPAWGDLLTAQEQADVIAYIKTFSEDFSGEAPTPIVIPTPPPVTSESIEEGRHVFMALECWSCHGPKGYGNGPSAKTLTDDWGRPIRPRNLTQARYRAGNDPASIYRTFSTGINGTPMAAYSEADFLINRESVADPAKLKTVYKEKDLLALRTWLNAQPFKSEVESWSDDRKKSLAEKHRWALAHYVNSLVKTPNFFVRMFTENTEVTP
jgi:mono/diheme cytochrome c family protein